MLLRSCHTGRTMSNPHHAVVWIDHQQAKIFRFDTGEVESTVFHSTHPHQNLHHKANSSDSGHVSVDTRFLTWVAESLSQAGTILIVGPAGAKQELATYLTENEPGIAARIAGVEPLDHPSDGQLLAFARKFFDADDRMRSQVRHGMHQ
jgi:stalled ribosome rescue protein Dom34